MYAPMIRLSGSYEAVPGPDHHNDGNFLRVAMLQLVNPCGVHSPKGRAWHSRGTMRGRFFGCHGLAPQ